MTSVVDRLWTWLDALTTWENDHPDDIRVLAAHDVGMPVHAASSGLRLGTHVALVDDRGARGLLYRPPT